MLQMLLSRIPLVGVIAAFSLLAISMLQYSGEVHWTRVTVSLLCAPYLPDGAPNPGRGLPIAALLLLCVSLALLFELISRHADSRGERKTIQIGGIGSMVYALLTATPMHDLMVNIALAFFLVALVAIVYMLFRKQQYVLAVVGISFLTLKLGSVSLYYLNTYSEAWGLLQKLSFVLTTTWLFAVHSVVQRRLTCNSPNGTDQGTEGLNVAVKPAPTTR